jgi:hypothetical protein
MISFIVPAFNEEHEFFIARIDGSPPKPRGNL